MRTRGRWIADGGLNTELRPNRQPATHRLRRFPMVSCTNKPNWKGPAGVANPSCETKPIFSQAGPRGSRPCETNPISGQPAPPGTPDCAKQTQFGPVDRESTPVGGAARSRRRPIVRNEPNSSMADFGFRIADCARQTQLAPRTGRWARGWSLSCETKPIPSEGRKSQVLAGKRVMVYYTCMGPRRNKPNSCPSADPEISVPGKPIVRNEPGFASRDGATGAWDARQTCETKPNRRAGCPTLSLFPRSGPAHSPSPAAF
jgi:hypothetical protein